MFRYRLHSPDGDDLGDATYAVMIKPGEEIHGGGGQRLRVHDVVPLTRRTSRRSSGYSRSSAHIERLGSGSAEARTQLGRYHPLDRAGPDRCRSALVDHGSYRS
jgi:hypothetical protein